MELTEGYTFAEFWGTTSAGFGVGYPEKLRATYTQTCACFVSVGVRTIGRDQRNAGCGVSKVGDPGPPTPLWLRPWLDQTRVELRQGCTSSTQPLVKFLRPICREACLRTTYYRPTPFTNLGIVRVRFSD